MEDSDQSMEGPIWPILLSEDSLSNDDHAIVGCSSGPIWPILLSEDSLSNDDHAIPVYFQHLPTPPARKEDYNRGKTPVRPRPH
ncbi:hypothetical protein QE152_g8498 [Popillia japonica]|uniref:Uncharacterized protein n=1 Tax=Popillia japonica TaxID=7064 RepID=A0AAW1MCL3_POPJA